jgi:leader peptidase (prepilin peptidase)/N-methyltransferase
LLKRRCRDCHAPISARYPLVELLTAAVFVAVTLRFHHSPSWLPAYLYLAGLGVALALIDIDVRKLPNALTLPAYLVGPVLLAIAIAGDGKVGWGSLLRAGAGLAAMYAFYYVLWFATSGRGMGFGDVKLAGVLGLFLAFLGWQTWAVGLFAGFFVGAVIGVGLMMGGRAGRKTKVPYGPFMLAGTFIAVFVGSGIAHSYLHVVGA